MESNSKVVIIKNIYFYLVSFVALMMIVFSGADAINTLLRSYVFTNADNMYYSYPTCAMKTPSGVVGSDVIDCQKQDEEMKKQAEQSRIANRDQSLVRDFSFILVGIPLFFFHWRIVRRKENKTV